MGLVKLYRVEFSYQTTTLDPSLEEPFSNSVHQRLLMKRSLLSSYYSRIVKTDLQ